LDRRELAYRFMYGRVLDIGCGRRKWPRAPPRLLSIQKRI